MNNFVKGLIVSVALTGMAYADTTSKWYVTVDDEYVVQDTDETGVYATLYETTGDNIAVSFEVFEANCDGWEEEGINADDQNINGTWVRMKRQCVDDGWISYYPATSTGREFVVSQFKKKRTVYLHFDDSDSLRFSGMGFTAAYNEYKKQLSRRAI